MDSQSAALDAERRFFAALIAGDVAALDEVLAGDFIMVDVMMGSEIPKAALIEVVRTGQLTFESIEQLDGAVRLYGETTAVITGSTRMRMHFDGQPIEAHSRYTHVFVEQDDVWRMVAAQGTPIAG